jgi:hypothetical protein
MSATRHVVLIRGNWGRGEQLAAARAAFELRGFTAHTPTLRYHELPMHDGAMKIASLSLRDYTEDLVSLGRVQLGLVAIASAAQPGAAGRHHRPRCTAQAG